MAFLAGFPPLLAQGGGWGGLPLGAAAYALAQLRAPASVVCDTPDTADRLARAIRFFQSGLPNPPPVRLYPADDCRPYAGASPDPSLPAARVLARAHAATSLVITPVQALFSPAPLELPQRALQLGQALAPTALAQWLTAAGYLSTASVEEPGSFGLRGGVMELWALGEEAPCRIEWFDDEIEAIRPRNGKPRKRLLVLPVREGLLTPETVERAAALAHRLAAERDAVPLYRRLIQDLRAGVWFPGAEDYLSLLHPCGPLALPGPQILLEPDAIDAEATRFAQQIRDRFALLDREEQPLIPDGARYLPRPPLSPVATLSRLAPSLARDLQARPGKDWRVVGADLGPLRAQLAAWVEEGRAVTLVAPSQGQAERLTGLLGRALPSGRARAGEMRIEIGGLPEGFVAPDQVWLTVGDLFGERLAAQEAGPVVARSRSGSEAFRHAARASLAKLQRGDAVIHQKHGVGLFRGLVRLPLGEVASDFLVLEYRDSQKLYVPVHNIGLVSPLAAGGPNDPPPRLDKLGGSTWELKKAKVRDAVLKLAHAQLQLHARRSLAKARPSPPPGELSLQFAETFPYVETPDQEAAIADVQEDLGREKPMDRLIVGDVGFGKTEVAMRAAFRVVEGGAQALILCPTTILAAQHAESFQRRMAPFPVRVELLSRFRSAKESSQILKDTAAGKVDILIATTRALSRGVSFSRLGLVVVDEEHRFGVQQKEQLQRQFAGIHALAMSATPIPRSLQLALSGMRSLSVIATPPEGRKQVRTEVVRFSPARVREDLQQELKRGGQAFFLHNRVQSIEGVARWLKKLVPEARIGIAHGQLSDEALEEVFVRFTRRELDVLVCTTIVESGVDLPQVNTLLINRADTFGLAQLYQLRGRVGRSAVQGICTLLLPGGALARRDALERLRALQEHTELGSNFSLASEDLELRGAGDILGERQHGHISAIGLDAYLELLNEAVASARGEATRAAIEPEVEIPLPAWLPEAWIPEMSARLEAYQQIGTARSAGEVRTRLDRLELRYGPAPQEALHLAWTAQARHQCKALGITRLSWLKVRVVMEIHPTTPLQPAKLVALAQREPQRFRLGGSTLEVRFSKEEAEHPFRLLEGLFHLLGGLTDKP